MMTISLKKKKLQSFTITIDNQRFGIRLYYCEFTDDLFFDLDVDEVTKIRGIKVFNGNLLVRYKYLKVNGDFVFADSQGNDDPVYTGFGDRWNLYYVTEDELNGRTNII